MVPHLDNSTVGQPLPAVEHAISVSLPTWAETLGYKKGEDAVLSRMQTGYPRYFIHMSIRKLAFLFERLYGASSERALPVRSLRAAEAGCTFINTRSEHGLARVFPCPLQIPREFQVHVVFFHAESFPIAKQFWQNTGLGVSSRVAEHYLMLAELQTPSSLRSTEATTPQLNPQTGTEEDIATPPNSSSIVKTVIRDRIASSLSRCIESAKPTWNSGIGYPMQGSDVTKEDVYLYPTGMSAIWSSHQLCMEALGKRKSVCFGFPYADTLKNLERWGPGCYFFADGRDSSIDELEKLLATLKSNDPEQPPILALFTEFPSNPLLRSVNLPRLRQLADKYDFLIVIDETIGNFANVRVMPYADIVITSLSKLFSGSANVMGGSLVLNIVGKYYAKLKVTLDRTYEDIYFERDAEVMEFNSRDFLQRSAIINDNAEAICEYLRSCSPVITEVYYPKWQTPSNYEACRIGGYGGLFSLMLASPSAARAFFDALSCAKGPSLGTNFTLACPYALLAHFGELDWAAQYGVPVELVRVSVGVEDKDVLMKAFQIAVKSAEEAHIKFAESCETHALSVSIAPDCCVET